MPSNLFIENRHWEIISAILEEHLTNRDIKVYIFGSRATGKNLKRGSDLDIALEANSGESIDLELINRLDFDFEDSNLPYKVDLIDLNSVSKEFKTVIIKDLVELGV